MATLSPAQRRALRAKAHHLRPVVSIGHHGLTPAVLHEIDVNLAAHELIKIRVFGDAREEREAMLARICAALDAAWVQHVGKLLIVWRAAPVDKAPPARPAAAAGKSAARKAPQVRRPRSPLPRVPARPPRSRAPAGAPAAPAQRRRKAPGASAAGAGARRHPAPHGKSASSFKGAAGARRRRKAR